MLDDGSAMLSPETFTISETINCGTGVRAEVSDLTIFVPSSDAG
jgi:hypothetical protein